MTDLAARDAEILAATRRGETETEISDRLGVTINIVRNVRKLAKKLAHASESVTEIPLALCRESPTARPVIAIKVEALARSIADVGLRQPINVRPISDFPALDYYEIRGGGHRVAAFRLLGRETIPAFVRSDDDLRAELAEIDENLVRNELSPAERAIAVSRRKAIYEELHPEAAYEARPGRAGKSRQVGDNSDAAERFTSVTAEATGASERTVQREAKRGEDIGADSLKRVVGTSLDKGEELDALAKLPEARREQLIAKAEAGETVTARGSGVNGERAIMSGRIEPDDSLDFFPTPPWATRALCEHVLPRFANPSSSTVWEPACGEGHMAAVLDEYFARVVATDIFGYGYCGGGVDFTAEKLELTPDADWIITNPPFGDAAETFVLRAIERARVGVAMFFRLQWLETVGRYERIFRPHPPRLIAQFTERVPLHKGRWEPDGDTATAYLWIVWTKGRVPGVGTEFAWIPPGRREALRKPDDVERFTAHPVKPRATTGGEAYDPETGEIEEIATPERDVSVLNDGVENRTAGPAGDEGSAADEVSAGGGLPANPVHRENSPGENPALVGSPSFKDPGPIPPFLLRDQANPLAGAAP